MRLRFRWPVSWRAVSSSRLTLTLLATGWLCSPVSGHAELNDTGITEFANVRGHAVIMDTTGFPGQDALFGRDAAAMAGRLKKVGGGNKGFDFTKLDANGAPLPSRAKKWSCVRDNVTGLIWELKTADRGLRDWRNTYSWYNPDNAVNGGTPGVKDGGKCTGGISCDTYAYTQAVNAGKLCGYSDWRVPDKSELRSIVDYGKAMGGALRALQSSERETDLATIDAAYFPHTPPRVFWSTTPYPGLSDSAWRVSFFNGRDTWGSKDIRKSGHIDLVHVRLVRGGH